MQVYCSYTNRLRNEAIKPTGKKQIKVSHTKELRKSIDYIYSQYLINLDLKVPPVNFTGLAEDIFFLKTFLDQTSEGK
jgi:hypothetical protein